MFVFHGFECGFFHSGTRQSFDVLLGFENEFGVLDPYFFARFLASTPGCELGWGLTVGP